MGFSTWLRHFVLPRTQTLWHQTYYLYLTSQIGQVSSVDRSCALDCLSDLFEDWGGDHVCYTSLLPQVVQVVDEHGKQVYGQHAGQTSLSWWESRTSFDHWWTMDEVCVQWYSWCHMSLNSPVPFPPSTKRFKSSHSVLSFHWAVRKWQGKRVSGKFIIALVLCKNCEEYVLILTLQGKDYQFHKSSGFQTMWRCWIVVVSLSFWFLEARKAVLSSLCFERMACESCYTHQCSVSDPMRLVTWSI